MDAKLQKNLLKSETVLWTGKASPFKLMEPPYNKKITTTLIISIALAILLPVWYVYYVTKSGVGVKWFVIAIVIVAMAFIATRPIFDKRTLEKKITYAITNLRAITYFGDNNFNSINLDKITDVRIDTLSNGKGVIYMGEACKKGVGKSRDLTLFGIKNDENELTGLAFYSVENVQSVRKHLPTASK